MQRTSTDCEDFVLEAILEIALGFQPKERIPVPSDSSRSDVLWIGGTNEVANVQHRLSLRDSATTWQLNSALKRRAVGNCRSATICCLVSLTKNDRPVNGYTK